MKKVVTTSPEGQRIIKVGDITLPLAQWRQFINWVKHNFGKKAKVGDTKLLLEVWMDYVK